MCENIDLKGGALNELCTAATGLSESRCRALIAQVKSLPRDYPIKAVKKARKPKAKKGKKNKAVDEAVDAVVCTAVVEPSEVTPVNSYALPQTEEELKEYRRLRLLSPEAKAMRLDALLTMVETERGNARLLALTELRKLEAEYDDNIGSPELVFVSVYDQDEEEFGDLEEI